MSQQAEHEKQKEELKKSADTTLSSVRKKISDAKKTQEFLKALQKLRKVRRVAAINQGRYASDVYDNNFEKKMKMLTSLIETQQTVYESEERTLKVMLDTVEEETMERDKEIKRLKELAKEKRDKKLAMEKLFGKKAAVTEDAELFPFYSYYTQAEHSIEALVQIRHEWDLHLVPPNIPAGSRIPDGWVIPAEPSSEACASALKD
ncbi:programmed cell death protein 7-like isoform X5 [Haliotis rubra]|uniref:programmed cell death protein 7-like isoform X5 n=1 Tax=Haliotis rubra TaxID=36100 RepID=UPI001EE53D35|nr:programmed cell death protein 7-like isoform X5 [Haliotis rubra]XP_046552022.1 programmed cell death protein 7-like isoform X5 [Haliotis rubra]XP_046552023.1 programmed cell death protein 7-like isoform X5 [Haliotis rubra]